jgi:hypothetical protein
LQQIMPGSLHVGQLPGPPEPLPLPLLPLLPPLLLLVLPLEEPLLDPPEPPPDEPLPLDADSVEASEPPPGEVVVPPQSVTIATAKSAPMGAMMGLIKCKKERMVGLPPPHG